MRKLALLFSEKRTLPLVERLVVLLGCMAFSYLPAYGDIDGGHEDSFQRLKGYYRVYQTTDSVLSYFWDGYMEIYVPLDSSLVPSSDFCDRKFLGERRRKAEKTNGDDLFVQINLPNLEVWPLASSIAGDEYSTRNNGDIYMLKYKAGHIDRNDSTTTVSFDELAGRPDHKLDMSQLKMYGVVATMTAYDETETRRNSNNDLVAFTKHFTYLSHYRGEDVDERIDVVCQFFVTDRQTISKEQKKRILKAKNHIWEFSIPAAVPPLPDNIASAWTSLVEY